MNMQIEYGWVVSFVFIYWWNDIAERQHMNHKKFSLPHPQKDAQIAASHMQEL